MSQIAERLRSTRRKYVKRYGRRLLRRINAWIGRQSEIPDVPVFPEGTFPGLDELSANWKLVRDDLHRVLERRDALPKIYDVSPDQKRIAADDNWTSFFFWGFGERIPSACDFCPDTARLLDQVPGISSAWFSILGPGAKIPPHRGVPKGFVRCHLALVVPDDRERCAMLVGQERVVWEEGRAVVFDDTFEHEVHNDTPQDRVVLLFDFERPMNWRGRLVHRISMKLMSKTAYIQDARRAHQTWLESWERAQAAYGALGAPQA